MILKFLLCFIFSKSVLGEDIIVTLPDGKVRGVEELTAANNTFYSFFEVPFAKPPLGELRFKPPQPVEKWEGILNATKSFRTCYQTNGNNDRETEDCLVLNVYTPVKPGTKAALPVMFYIFGGGFINGNSLYSGDGPHYLIDEGVIVVTTNYRVGSFGFLSTGDLVIPGNNGLRDQNMGLQWVQKNIGLFGGDPNKVTIFGQSAGGASVTYQILSKQSEGLFRGGIAQSGSFLCPWSFQRHHVDIAYQVAKNIDPTFTTNNSSEELLKLLQSVSAKELDEASSHNFDGVNTDEMVQGFYFAPVVEPEYEGAFITEPMFESLKNGRINNVSLMIGICDEEQLNRAYDLESFKKEMIKYDEDTSRLLMEDLHCSLENATAVGNDVRKIYVGDGLLQENLGPAVRFFSDTSFSRPIIKHAELQSQYTDVYFYQFSYHGHLGSDNYDFSLAGAGLVIHSEDTHYLWAKDNNSDLSRYDKNDATTLLRYVRMFTNFAKYLNPTPKPEELLQNITVPKVTPNNFQFVKIDKDFSIESDPKNDSQKGWNQIYKKWGVPPFDTY